MHGVECSLLQLFKIQVRRLLQGYTCIVVCSLLFPVPVQGTEQTAGHRKTERIGLRTVAYSAHERLSPIENDRGRRSGTGRGPGWLISARAIVPISIGLTIHMNLSKVHKMF